MIASPRPDQEWDVFSAPGPVQNPVRQGRLAQYSAPGTVREEVHLSARRGRFCSRRSGLGLLNSLSRPPTRPASQAFGHPAQFFIQWGLSLALWVAMPLSVWSEDTLQRLQENASPQATRTLADLYGRTRDGDQRFWLIQALGMRFKKHADVVALEALFKACEDTDPNVRGHALRSMTYFTSLPPSALQKEWLVRLDGAAARGIKDRVPAVRGSAMDLKHMLELWRATKPADRSTVLEHRSSPSNRPWIWSISLRWGWLLGLSAFVLAWVCLPPLRRFRKMGLVKMPRVEKRAVSTRQAPAALGPYSQAICVDQWVFVSGQIPMDPDTGKLVEGGIREQTRQVLKNLQEILSALGLGYGHVVKTTVFLKDLAMFPDMNDIYGEVFSEPMPARSTVEVSALPKGALIEIEAVARG